MIYHKDNRVPPKRTVWADKTKLILEDIQKRRAALMHALDVEESQAKMQCNHTFQDGTSMIETGHDYDDDQHYAICKVCRQT